MENNSLKIKLEKEIKPPINERIKVVRKCAAKVWNVTENDIMSRKRDYKIVAARQMVCYKLVMDGYKRCDIAKAMHIDKTTILNSIRKYSNGITDSTNVDYCKMWEHFCLIFDMELGVVAAEDVFKRLDNLL